MGFGFGGWRMWGKALVDGEARSRDCIGGRYGLSSFPIGT